MDIPYAGIIIARSQYHDDIDKYNIFQRTYLKIQYWIWKRTMLKSYLPKKWEKPMIYKEDISNFLQFLRSITYPRSDTVINIKIGHQYLYEFDLNSIYKSAFYITTYDLLKNTSSRVTTTFVDGNDGKEGTALFTTMKLTVMRYIMGENNINV